MLHAILVDGMIERIEGCSHRAESEIKRYRAEGHNSEYLFAARSDREFEQKREVRSLLSRMNASAH